MSLFSMLDQVEDGHGKLLSILSEYNLSLSHDELNMIKYGPLGDRYNPYIPKVSKKEHRRFKELMKKEREGIFLIAKRRKRWAEPPGSQLKTPDKIILKYGEREYKFSEDDLLKHIFTKYLQQLFTDYHKDEINLINTKQHYFKALIASLVEYLKSFAARQESTLSMNRILQLAYDIMALSYPVDFIDEPNYEDHQDKNRYKASRIRAIINETKNMTF